MVLLCSFRGVGCLVIGCDGLAWLVLLVGLIVLSCFNSFVTYGWAEV